MVRIAVATSSRADYGLLKPLLELIPKESLNLIVTGSHLCYEHGYTVKEIECPHETIEILLSSDTPEAIAKSMGLAQIGVAEVFSRTKPHCLIALGDRFEVFAICSAAHIFNIPIIHIHGGEVTAGAYDDAFRHSITKMSQLHFVAAEPYRDRVIQLGEHPDTVFNVGALGCDGLTRRVGYENNKSCVLIQHPETLGDYNHLDLYSFLTFELKLYVKVINSGLDKGSHKNKNKEASSSYPREAYLNMLKQSDFIIGNSSSSVIEAPALGVPTILLGDRQLGRELADSIIIADTTPDSIRESVEELYSEDFQDEINNPYNTPYLGGNVAWKILSTILNKLPDINMKKGFHDLF